MEKCNGSAIWGLVVKGLACQAEFGLYPSSNGKIFLNKSFKAGKRVRFIFYRDTSGISSTRTETKFVFSHSHRHWYQSRQAKLCCGDQ